jgi:diguanylate cyclase (GGDEF)-like protein
MGELVRTLGDVIEEPDPESSFFFQMPGGAHGDIRDRIAEHLDAALFTSVLEGEVRALSNASTFATMFDSLSQLLTQLVDYRWVALSTSSPGYFAIHAHRRQAESAEREALQVLDVSPGAGRTIRIQDDDALDVERIDRTIVCNIEMGNIRLGQLAFGLANASPQIDKIAPAVARELASVVKLVLLVEESQRLAMTDGLTGLKNRRAFIQELEREIVRSNRTGARTSLLLLDLDHFKSINDTHGHGAGDAVLVAIGQTLSHESRAYDIVGRWGGEEFVVALPATEGKNALIVAERLRQAIERLEVRHSKGDRIPLSASIGAVELRANESLDSVVDRADRAMYAAKVSGRNRVCEDPHHPSLGPARKSFVAA